ncbi:MAG: radical SAM domain-containing [Geobacteraceae bacterium]|nr:MAG: radical SAM domain-containing [Geobacteraceae bacterium]
MSWKIIEKYRKILAGESGATRKDRGGKLTVCLVYPNHYRIAMSNLGFQAVYALLNSHTDVLCERAFLPDPEERREYEKSRTSLLSLESQRPLTEFDVVAFSVSFESDYLNIPAIFHLAGIPPFAAKRAGSMPLVIAGGAALFLNPEPVADFMDLVAVGEAEAILPRLLGLLTAEGSEGREELLRKAVESPGIYVPSFYEAVYDGPKLVAFKSLAGELPPVKRGWEPQLDRHPTHSVLLTPGTEFSDMYLIELSRGCPRGCRFCAAGFIYLPYRQRSLEEIKTVVARGLAQKEKVGLVGAAVSDYRGIGELCRHILEKGGKVSVSSLRIDALDEEMIEVLKASGHKTVALAPEGGSQRLRDLIGKNIDEQQILAACNRLIEKDILNLKLYFIIGLPTETSDDLEEMVGLVTRIRERVIASARKNRRLGEVVLSINPFVPKPFTPFQWCGMEGIKSLERKMRFLQQAVRPLSNVRMQMEGPKDAYLQALLSRGDRRLSRLLVRAHELGSWKRAAKELSLDTDFLVCRDIPLDELLPWDFIESGDRERLVRENRLAFGDGED